MGIIDPIKTNKLMHINDSFKKEKSVLKLSKSRMMWGTMIVREDKNFFFGLYFQYRMFSFTNDFQSMSSIAFHFAKVLFCKFFSSVLSHLQIRQGTFFYRLSLLEPVKLAMEYL